MSVLKVSDYLRSACSAYCCVTSTLSKPASVTLSVLASTASKRRGTASSLDRSVDNARRAANDQQLIGSTPVRVNAPGNIDGAGARPTSSVQIGSGAPGHVCVILRHSSLTWLLFGWLGP